MIVKNFASWIVASIVAAALVWGVMVYKDASHNQKPCRERACYMMLENRVAALEKNQYTNTDALRDQKLMSARIDALRKR